MQLITRKAIILIILVSLCVLGIVPQALAANYKIVGNANGLTIEAVPFGHNTGNLNPGDQKKSSLRLKNTNDDEIIVWIRTNITGRRKGPNGGDLAEVLHLLIKDGSRTITDDSFDGAAADEFVRIGTMDPGEEKLLEFTVTLPGPETGNEYQGSSIDANWTFRTQSESGGGGGGGGRGGGGGGDTPGEPTTEIPEEPVPGGPTETPGGEIPGSETPNPDIEIIEEEPVPGGSTGGPTTAMPKTGEIPPVYFYGIGSLVMLTGVVIRKRKK